MEEFEPILSISIINTKTHGVNRTVGADIDEKGNLVFSGLDWSTLAEQMLGGDYEYSITVSAELKDSLLLLLLKEKFDDFPEFKHWLENKGIPFKHWSYS